MIKWMELWKQVVYSLGEWKRKEGLEEDNLNKWDLYLNVQAPVICIQGY